MEDDIATESPKVDISDQCTDKIEEVAQPPAPSLKDNHELNTSHRILTEIIRQNKTTCWPFLDEVDVKGLGLWDYAVKIKEPMWLNKMVEKFDNNEYTSITEFAKDFRTMVENCYRYNGTDHVISKKAKRLEMVFEGKLALLKRDLREKASLQMTTGGRFAITTSDDSASSMSRSCRGSSTREAILDDSSAKLVYDFVKCEETMCMEDEKKASYRERRQQELLYQRIAASWINSLEESEDAKLINTCSALPEIGFFLHLTESVLKFPELNMYSLERSFLVSEHSMYLAKIMTCLLCTYQERSQIHQRPPMQFLTWNKRLKERVNKWFETAHRHRSYLYAAERIGIDVKFFEVMRWENPFSSKETFADLDFAQRVEIMKALCDTMFLLQSIQTAMLSMDPNQLQCMELGKDYSGNIYIYFPQFCGDDVRIYRHREYGEPTPIPVPDVVVKENIPNTVDKNDTPDIIGQENEKTDTAESGGSNDNKLDSADPSTPVSVPDVVEKEYTPNTIDRNDSIPESIGQENEKIDTVQSDDSSGNTLNSADPSCDNLVNGEKRVTEESETSNTNISQSQTASVLENDKVIKTEVKEEQELKASNAFANGRCSPTHNDGREDIVDGKSATPKTETFSHDTEIKHESPHSPKLEQGPLSEDSVQTKDEISSVSLPNGDSADASVPSVETHVRTPRARKRNPKYDDSPAKPRTPRSLRKRTTVNYNDLSKPVKSADPPPKKKRKAAKKKEVPEPEPEAYGSVEFEMLCDSVESIQILISELQAQREKVFNEKNDKSRKQQTDNLIEKLQWLYNELEPWSIKLQKAKLSAQIQMKREHDRMKLLPQKSQSDPWAEELTSKNTYMHGENLTISHTGVYSPASSIASYNDDSSDEDYVHSYFTRRSNTQVQPPPEEIDETLYLEAKEQLLDPALLELESILQENVNYLVKMTSRTELHEGAGPHDSRYTRGKRKKQNKILGKILKFAEEKATVRPTMLPVLLPDSDVYDIVDTLLLREEMKQQTLLEERRKKKLLKRKIKAPLPKSKLAMEDSEKNSNGSTSTNTTTKTPNYSYDASKIQRAHQVAIRMQNGKIYPATRLQDGSVIPITRLPGTSHACSVEELINNTKKELERKASVIPHISLTGSDRLKTIAMPKGPDIKLLSNHDYCKPPSTAPQSALVSAQASKPPTSQIHSTLKLSTVTVKQSPTKFIASSLPQTSVKQPVVKRSVGPAIQFVQRNVQMPPHHYVNTNQMSTAASNQIVNTVPRATQPANGARYGLTTLAFNQQRGQAIVLSPSSHVLVRPILTPVQIVSSPVKYQTNPAPMVCNNSNKNYVLVQNGVTPAISQVRFVTPVMGLITQPQSQKQMDGNQKQ